MHSGGVGACIPLHCEQMRKQMGEKKRLYYPYHNPLLVSPARALPKEMAVLGAGTIGPDIGYYLKRAMPDSKLFLVDVVEKPLKNAQKRLSGYAERAVDRKKMTAQQAEAVLADISYTMAYEDLKDCDLVIEAATENIPLKQKIFESIEKIVRADTLITSNTSSIPADRIFSRMERPDRATVTHFFAPAWRSLPVEVVSWEKVNREVLDYLFWLFAATGKVPLITDNVICFMLDRVFVNWCNEAAQLLPDVTASQVDKVTEEFVFAGPFFVLNMVNGNPVIIETNTLQAEEGEHYKPARLLASVDRWHTHRPGTGVDMPRMSRETIRDRMLGVIFSQCFDIIDRGIGTKEDLNFGCQIALGFREGPLDIMRDLGEDEVNRIMQKFDRERPGYPQPNEAEGFYQDFNRYILVDDVNGVKVITIRRPQAMNALNDEVTAEILKVLEEYAHDPAVKGFVITGYGSRAFSAGADIGKFPEMLGNRDASIQYSRDCANVQLFMDRMQKPVVAAVNGMALGGGLELAIRCHSIVATRNAVFQFPEITLGILPGIGGCVVPYRKWPKGASLFHEMICLGRRIGVEEALNIGMVDEAAEDYSDLIGKAVNLAGTGGDAVKRIPDGRVQIPPIEIPSKPMAGGLALSKEALSIIVKTIEAGAAAEHLSDALEIGYAGFGEIACADAAQEGITAFLQKRRPEYNK